MQSVSNQIDQKLAVCGTNHILYDLEAFNQMEFQILPIRLVHIRFKGHLKVFFNFICF